MHSPKKIVIMVGEASGDQHAAHLVLDLKKKAPDIYFSGIGGQNMQAAGVELIHDIKKLNIMGFIEVVRHIISIRRIFKDIEHYLLKTKPDLLILVDYPGFNLRLAKKAHAMGIKVLYYISPQLWAWKPGRIAIIQENVNAMAVILPFEKKIYDDAYVPAYFVGHPLIQTVKTTLSPMAFREKWQLSLNKKIIGLLPGSRKGEIHRMLPVMLKAAALLDAHYPEQLIFVLPIASTITLQDLEPYTKKYTLSIHYISADNYNFMQACHSLMITSGTATLEAALLGKPMVITYKTSAINYAIAVKVIRVKYIGLCNLLAQKMIVPEILQQDLTPEHLFQAMKRYLDDPLYYHNTEKNLLAVRDSLSSSAADKSLTDVALDLIK